MGGLARRAAFIKELRAKGGPVEVVDSGDHFFGDLSLLEIQVPQLKLKARVAAEGMKAIGYRVFCPGEADFGAGFAMLKELIAAAGVTPVCANLKHGDQPAFEPTVVVQVGGVKVGYFGVLKSDRPLPAEGGKPLTLTDPYDAARAAVAALKAQNVDVIVALSHLGFVEDEQLAKGVPGIDLILGGHARDVLPGKNVNDAWIHHAGHQGRQIVVIKVSPQAGKRPHVATEVIDLPLDKPEDPVLAERYKKYEEEVKKLNAAQKVPEKIAQNLDERWFGAQLCGQCHPAQDKFWKGTLHSHAFETLVRKGKTTDSECLQCHTAWYGRARPPGASSIIEVTGFEAVQCESCHGPGSGHAEPPIRTAASKRETCVRCHDPKNSPKFDFETWLPKVRCPADPPRQD